MSTSDKLDFAKQSAHRIKDTLRHEGYQWYWGTAGDGKTPRFKKPTDAQMGKLEYLILEWIESIEVKEQKERKEPIRHVRFRRQTLL